MGWKQYFVYLLTNYGKTVVYTGMSNSLQRRIWEHKHDMIEGFTKRYKCHYLIYFEIYTEVTQAIAREKQIKGWIRAKKDALIATMNPDWNDLAHDWYREEVSS